MCRPEQIVIVIPCLNEGRTIGALVRQARRFVPNVIIIDDGSTDATRSCAENAGAAVLIHPEPQGKGTSLRAGLEAAHSHGFTWALVMDGDGQHSPEDIPHFIAAAENSPADLMIGNRMGNDESMPFLRRIVNRAMSRAISKFCDLEIPDSQCGFRLINLDAWRGVPMSSRHFEIESEMLVRFLHAGHRVAFVPVQTHYSTESSKIRPIRDTIRWFRWWFAVRNELAVQSLHSRYKTNPRDATA